MLELHTLITVCNHNNWKYQITQGDYFYQLIGINKGTHVWHWFRIFEKDEHHEVSVVDFSHSYSMNTGKTHKGWKRGYKLRQSIQNIFDGINENAPVWTKVADPEAPENWLALENDTPYIVYRLNHPSGIKFEARMDTRSLSSVWELVWDGCDAPVVLPETWGTHPNSFVKEANAFIDTLTSGDMECLILTDLGEYKRRTRELSEQYDSYTEQMTREAKENGTESTSYQEVVGNRRVTWQLLQSLKSARVICPTTGFELTLDGDSDRFAIQTQRITPEILQNHKLYVNISIGTDCLPHEVVSTTPKGTILTIRPMDAKLLTKMEMQVGGFLAHTSNNYDQEYEYSSLPDAGTFTVTVSPKRIATSRGKARLSHKPTYFYDYNK